MKIGITYNLKADHEPQPGDPADRYEEFDSEETIAALEEALRALGHLPVRLGWGWRLIRGIERAHQLAAIDAVFNIAEGIGGRGREAQVPALLEMLAIPHTGSDALALALTLDKAIAKRLAAVSGIATAPFAVVNRFEDISEVRLRYPLFAKPAAEGSSMGIRPSSRCETPDQLQSVVRELLGAYGQPVLIEEFLSGDEFTIGIVGNGDQARVIGAMQIIPKGPQAADFIYSLDVKRDFRVLVDYVRPDPGSALTRAVEEVALQVHRTFDCRDVSRVDVRLDRDGKPNFIEVNPLPGINPSSSDLVILSTMHGWSYHQLIGAILDAAVERWSQTGLIATPV